MPADDVTAARRVPYIHVSTDDADLLRWSYLLQGPPDTPFAGGWYWGKLIFPPEYPFKPPRLEMATPSGRFQPNTRLCLSMSDYHPESWNPSWGLGTVLTGLLSFMVSNDRAEGAQNHLGAMQTSDAEKRKLAKASLAWNKKQAEFMTRFPLINALVAAASPAKGPPRPTTPAWGTPEGYAEDDDEDEEEEDEEEEEQEEEEEEDEAGGDSMYARMKKRRRRG